MSIWNKILVWLVAIAGLGFFYTAARTVRTVQHWAEKNKAFAQSLEKVQGEVEGLRFADHDKPLPNKSVGVICLQSELEQLQTNRGRIWEKCEPSVNAQTGTVGLTTPHPTPNGITMKMILYAFEEGDEQRVGQYLGEFKVAQVSDSKVELKPTAALTDREARRLLGSRGTWTLYELMPADQHELFAEMTDERKKALLPETSLAEYLRDGTPAQPEDPQLCTLDLPIVGKNKDGPFATPDGKYHRLLRDYKQIFQACRADRILFNDARESLTRDNGYLAHALNDANVQTQFAQDVMDKLRKSQSNVLEQKTTVEGYLGVLQGRCALYIEALDKMLAKNQKTADDIRSLQAQVARLIEQRANEQRTRLSGQIGPGN